MNEGSQQYEGESSPGINSIEVSQAPNYEAMTREELIDLAKEQDKKNKELTEENEKDALTGLRNRRFFVQKLEAFEKHAKHREEHTSIIMIDLDRFKNINDTLGHAAGDEVLRQVSLAISRTVRATDVVARMGGEEIAVILYSPDEARASEIAEEIRVAIESVQFFDLPDLIVTASIGVAEYTHSFPYQQIINNADRALYGAKRAGRNRVVRFSDIQKKEEEQYSLDLENTAEEK